MRAVREKDLQEFAKKQAEMEATLRDHREEQRVEQEHIRLEQEERMKRKQERMQQEQERMRKEQERLRAEISKELEKKMSSVMEKKMSDMSKRLFSQFGGSKDLARSTVPEDGKGDSAYGESRRTTSQDVAQSCYEGKEQPPV
ncbi:hypothetical protein CJ030_MR0G007201 [Morella rubra]|uniref:Uncharacterized protein n=1 Tax=Morella rubra TaxID=262757 RepID=A0A6A1UJN1_9ROSI|nr:hypothetical protein CJ030_MR0G007201 [Morella rubra]